MKLIVVVFQNNEREILESLSRQCLLQVSWIREMPWEFKEPVRWKYKKEEYHDKDKEVNNSNNDKWIDSVGAFCGTKVVWNPNQRDCETMEVKNDLVLRKAKSYKWRKYDRT